MTAARTERPSNVLLAVMSAVVAFADGVLAVLGATAWLGYRDGGFSGAEAAPFIVMGVSAAVGGVLALLAMIAFLRGRRGQGLARALVNLAWLRLGAVVIALAVVALTHSAATVAVFSMFGIAVAVGDAVGGLIVTGAALRRTRDR
ncbi:hypothetical protein GCM10010112_87710 [Actinoplanes lobatus]|uniref:GNAT superfamily N-acetyltransferase n=1 Tax=Actinoplanes lobatus TaxID=113568 RepID=A0A7W7MMA0_9ACTN|nr:hypothetical protein [Actinoplanes lobatus]MBB4755146.1 GNAT superfamily N-acetyltransferase [Actinoplanes lobatus]GGN96449.1 hypothetical protein GCM10010112_87710 [Actinoplanes lobatus]GIE45391.1 hypothetical protein Alo02nite_82890 [Actinoplanes lobatus]